MTSRARWSAAAIVSIVLLVACALPAQAQRPATTPRRDVPHADTIQHSPFIPGGHWRPGRPAPVPQPAPAVAAIPPSAVTDSAGYFARPNGTLVRTDSAVYRLELRRDTLVIPLGVRTVTVAESKLGGIPDWLVTESRTGTAIATYDSLHLHRADLTPMRWTARNGLSQLAVSFTTDSMFVALQDYQGRGSFAVGLPPGALITPGMVDQLLALMPLGADYRVNASMVVVDSGAPRAVAATISVEGQESVTLAPSVAPLAPVAPVSATPTAGGVLLAGASPPAAGVAIDCWVVVLRTGAQEKRFWVAKSPQRVVKSEQQTSGGVLVELLEQPSPVP
jgi:hypothetical protein